MPNLNLQGLIDEVLNMVRNRDTSSSGGAAGWYGGNKDEEAYWSDMRKRNTILEQQKLVNEGHVNVENVRSAGELARQRLANEGAANTASSGLEGHKYAADQALKGQEAHANAIITAAGEKSDGKAKSDGRVAYENWAKNAIGATPEQHLEAWRKFAALDQKPLTALSQPGMTDAERVNIKKMYDSIYGTRQQPGVLPPKPGQPAPGITPPDATKKGDYFTKDAPAQPGASSMEFASDEVLKKRKLAERNKKVEEDMFGKPKRSSFLPW